MPSIPKGTRDFQPAEMSGRNYIFDTVKRIFKNFGFLPIETPSMENIETLTGKYGDEGDKLIFRILNSGDFVESGKLKNISGEEFNSKKLSSLISEKALRYDLTVPFARYVVMHRNDIVFPFKRYQIQPVWRADRPQKGRFREFYQCDIDVIGSDSLLNEIELLQVIEKVFSSLNLKVTIKLNNRKILFGLAEAIGASEHFTQITMALDKLEKVGEKAVIEELGQRGIKPDAVEKMAAFLRFISNEKISSDLGILSSDNHSKSRLEYLTNIFNSPSIGVKGLEEMNFLIKHIKSFKFDFAEIEFDPTLARGLDYYTGSIFEVIAKDAEMGSLCGGGRYDNLTGVFGLPGISGVGISFGADRIYEVLKTLNLIPENTDRCVSAMLVNFGEAELEFALSLLAQLREAGIGAELYPDNAKLKKQFAYADAGKIPFVLMAGRDEILEKKVSVKNMQNGEQVTITEDEVSEYIINASHQF